MLVSFGSGQGFNAQRTPAAYQLRCGPPVEAAEPDRSARPAARAVEHREIAPGRAIAEIASRFAAETAAGATWCCRSFGRRIRVSQALISGCSGIGPLPPLCTWAVSKPLQDNVFPGDQRSGAGAAREDRTLDLSLTKGVLYH